LPVILPIREAFYALFSIETEFLYIFFRPMSLGAERRSTSALKRQHLLWHSTGAADLVCGVYYRSEYFVAGYARFGQSSQSAFSGGWSDFLRGLKKWIECLCGFPISEPILVSSFAIRFTVSPRPADGRNETHPNVLFSEFVPSVVIFRSVDMLRAAPSFS
jgi:hypothetical protein